MGRKMVKMARITNEKTRVTTYKKRKACLYKKASEFSTLCGVDTCMIVYGPNKAGEEMVEEPEVWPRDENKVREIISKYRDTLSSSCTKTFTVQECLEKSNKVAKPVKKYCPWDEKLDKCSLNELYTAFVAVGNKIQEAADRKSKNQTTFPNQLAGFCGYNQQSFEQHHQFLFPLPTMDHNMFPFPSLFNQMTSSNTAEMASFPNMTEPEIAHQAMMLANGQNMYYGSCSDGQYGAVVQRTAYMDPMQWGLGTSSVFTDYPLRFAQVNGLEDSAKPCM